MISFEVLARSETALPVMAGCMTLPRGFEIERVRIFDGSKGSPHEEVCVGRERRFRRHCAVALAIAPLLAGMVQASSHVIRHHILGAAREPNDAGCGLVVGERIFDRMAVERHSRGASDFLYKHFFTFKKDHEAEWPHMGARDAEEGEGDPQVLVQSADDLDDTVLGRAQEEGDGFERNRTFRFVGHAAVDHASSTDRRVPASTDEIEKR